MTHVTTMFGRALLGIGIGATALLWNGQVPTGGNTQLTSSAEARAGRPDGTRDTARSARRS